MSIAENLLNSLPETAYENSRIAGSGADEEHIVVNENREVIVPENLKIIAVQDDKDVETVTIDCIRYWDNHDLSTFDIYIKCELTNRDEVTYTPEEISVKANYFSFDWVIGREITPISGKLKFWIVAKIVDENDKDLYQWSSLQNEECSVASGGGQIYVPEDTEEKDTESKNINQVRIIEEETTEGNDNTPDFEEAHIVVNGNRRITVPDNLKIIAVKGDKNIETVTIDCVRFWDGHDLSTFAVYINYKLPNGKEGTYIPKTITVKKDVFSFDWVIERYITSYVGLLTFWIVTKDTDDSSNLIHQWSSFQNQDCSIEQGGDKIYVPEEQTDKDIISQAISVSRQASEDAQEAAKRAEEAADRAESGGGGVSPDLEDRLSKLEQWMNDEVTYEPIKFDSFTMEPSKTQYEYGDTVSGIKLTWALSRAAKKITVNGVEIDNNATEYIETGPFTEDKSWTVEATDAKDAVASVTKSITFYYEPIKFDFFNMIPSNTQYEYGNTPDSIKIQWVLNRAATKITVNGAEISPTATEYVATGPFTTDQSWTVVATGAKGETARRTTGIKVTYESIDFKSFTLVPPKTQYEYSAESISLKLRWELNRAATKITVNGVQIDPTSTEYDVTGTFTADQSWEVIVTGAKNETAKRTTGINFLNGVYYGALEEPAEYNSDFILNLTKELRSNKKPSFSVTAGTGQYIYYCLPTRMGTCSFKVGGFEGGFYLVKTISFENESKYIEDYYIYRSDNASLGDTSVEVL